MNYTEIPEDLKIKAKKIEEELLNDSSNNYRHIKEERGLEKNKDYQDEDIDEETLYSSVIRQPLNVNNLSYKPK